MGVRVTIYPLRSSEQIEKAMEGLDNTTQVVMFMSEPSRFIVCEVRKRAPNLAKVEFPGPVRERLSSEKYVLLRGLEVSGI